MQPDVLVVGAGFAGMYAIHRFKAMGFSVQVLEAGTDVGGTWYWNRYPGARCDVPSLEYSFGFSPELEQEWDWPEVFSAQPDILAYANHIADRFDLRAHIKFNTRVTAVEFQDQQKVWRLTTEHGETFEAKYCVMATGCLSVPNKPSIAGADQFAGLELHTGLWPHEPVDLSGKRVGIIGTGSSGVQAIPELAKQAEHLTVFQRTPVYTMPANRKAMRPAVAQEFKDHYRDIRALQQANPGGVSNFRPQRGKPHSDTRINPSARGSRKIKELSESERRQRIADGGLNALLGFSDVYTDLEANEIANDLYREAVRAQVEDATTAEALLPKDYGLGCKRQVLDRDYYATYNRSNVTLVDLHQEPLEQIEARGVRTIQGLYQLDVLVYATGFDAMTGALLKANMRGRNGVHLADKWRDGPVTYLGLQMHGFPNLFTVTGPGSPSVLCNMLVAIEQHINWIGDCMRYMQDHELTTIEPRETSEQTWITHVNEVAEGTMYTSPSCNSWYLGANIPGKPRIFMPYVGGYPRYKAHCDNSAANGYKEFNLT